MNKFFTFLFLFVAFVLGKISQVSAATDFKVINFTCEALLPSVFTAECKFGVGSVSMTQNYKKPQNKVMVRKVNEI
jgi:hypothetical protein